MFGSFGVTNKSATAAKTAADLRAITGLTEQRAKECFDNFGCYEAALASFVQSFNSLSDDFFEARSTATKNATKINDELRVIYAKAREAKAKTGKSDADVWKAYPTSAEQTTTAAATTAPAPAAAKPSSAIPFGFGAAAPSTTKVEAAAPAATPAKSVFGAPPSVFAAPPSTSAAAPAAPPAFGFGQAPVRQSASSGGPSTSSMAAAFSAFGKPAAVAEVKPEKKPVKYCSPVHFTGPYFEMPLFWEEEVVGRAPLLNLNHGFLEANKDALRARLEKWVAKASFYKTPVKYVEIEDDDEEVVRVIIKDADRTFFHPLHRAKMVAFLNAMYHEFNAYGQAMSYLAGLCMLVLSEEETAAVIRFVSTEYIKGHWAAEAVGFATSAWVVEFFMQKQFPDVAAHLEKLNFWPDTYLQKILTGLCIHVLNFNELFDFLDKFMQGGLPFLIRFCLAIVEHFRSDLLRIQTSAEANALYEIMRLDSRVADLSDIHAILERAPLIDLGEDGSSIDLIRSQVYEKKVEPRLQRAPKTDTFEPCEVCEKNRPKWWNEDLGAVCDECKAKHSETVFEKY